jgi:hypothetical protein
MKKKLAHLTLGVLLMAAGACQPRPRTKVVNVSIPESKLRVACCGAAKISGSPQSLARKTGGRPG